MVTSEIVGITKPDLAGFSSILDYTKLPPALHLMIGDREAIDHVPAKKLGMSTCLVWSEAKRSVVDLTLPTVYDVAKLLTN